MSILTRKLVLFMSYEEPFCIRGVWVYLLGSTLKVSFRHEIKGFSFTLSAYTDHVVMIDHMF